MSYFSVFHVLCCFTYFFSFCPYQISIIILILQEMRVRLGKYKQHAQSHPEGLFFSAFSSETTNSICHPSYVLMKASVTVMERSLRFCDFETQGQVFVSWLRGVSNGSMRLWLPWPLVLLTIPSHAKLGTCDTLASIYRAGQYKVEQ